MIEEASKITPTGQTTIPKSVRRALGVDEGGTIVFRLSEDGVSLHRVGDERDDPALDGFLSLVGESIASDGAREIPHDLATRIFALTDGLKVDLDDAIEGPVAL